MSLEGRRAAVTGGARGIGRACALALATAGAHVSILDVLPPDETVAAVLDAGGAAEGARLDVRDRAAVAAAIGRVVEEGGLDILVTAAGVYGTTADIAEVDEREAASVVEVNLLGTLWCLQAALPPMRARGSGAIVCVGSVAGRVGGVLAGPHYVATKGAVHAMVKWVAKSGAAHGVRCNAVAPGVIDTDMIRGMGYTPDYCPLGRLGTPGDIASAVLYLASPASDYVTGTVLDVNGGYFMG